jgi:hypothetical protein
MLAGFSNARAMMRATHAMLMLVATNDTFS